ncbi:MAG: dual specificity protein phosphatase family protein, partial [Planctomycetia bacterium]|nr:dual specificity protein phosphatase family protein [Planctomycetia bacterium]
MSKTAQWISGITLALLLVAAPVAWSKIRKHHFRNFRSVEAGVLYRSGQLSPDGLKRVIHDHGIKTVVSLRAARNDGEAAPDLAEQKYCLSQEMKYHRLPFWKADGTAPDDANVAKFLAIMDDPKNYPVLVHCFAGKHRTGTFVAVWRMEKQRWSNAEAIAELQANGYEHLQQHEDVDGFLKNYVPRWKRAAADNFTSGRYSLRMKLADDAEPAEQLDFSGKLSGQSPEQ